MVENCQRDLEPGLLRKQKEHILRNQNKCYSTIYIQRSHQTCYTINDKVMILRSMKYIIEGSLNRNFRQYGELKSSSRVIKSVDRRCNSQKVRRKKIHPRQMLEKSRNAVFFHRFVCRVSPKVGLLKRRVRR